MIGRRRRFFRRRRRSKLMVPLGFPRQKSTLMRYQHHIYEDQESAAGAGWTVRLLSIFDPQYAVGGHLPAGYNAWSALYRKYQVMWSRVRSTFAFRDPTGVDVASSIMIYFIVGRTAPVSQAEALALMESGAPWFKYKIISGADFQRVHTITYNFKPKQWYNLRDWKDDPSSWANFGTNPARDTTGVAGYVAMHGTDPPRVDINHVVTYKVRFANPILHTTFES